ncbi:hypothetical protein SUGI_0034570 [Cryptomeria japonica]|nr:hypothetical protein SUGI_0034570 [Cryptomeria japonica]
MEIYTQYQPPTIKIPFDVTKKFHVFLSFYGKDVRKTFVDHLYESLCVAGLRVFLDSEDFKKGKDVDSTLKMPIETSHIVIPIFSRFYAESPWCLEEAARMIRSNGFIIPLFYDVEPSDVRYPQRNGGLFARAFQNHYTHLDRQDEKTIEEWKKALHQISFCSGWTREAEFGYEGRLVKKVMKDVLNTFKNTPLDVPVHLVGLQTDIYDLLCSLNLSSWDSTVRVGISGLGGVGKTTLAKAVYNKIHGGFDACCFVFNIGAAVEKNTRLVDLQRTILRRLVNYHEEISSVDEGKALMRDRLRGVRTLVILDGVDDRSQLQALNGDWFGYGSRIIITSRDQHILNLAKVDSVHKMSGLQQHESRQLFSWHAFSRPFPDSPDEEISTRIAQACCGNPLSLEVIGSHLFDKKESNEIQCWEEILLNIGENPKMSTLLRVSYDGLGDIEKEIFLDVACNFVGEKKRHAVIFWEVLYPNKVQTAIKNLLLKMLINISGPQELLHMHDLLREMGRGIQKEADHNSRLWLPMSTHNALKRDRAERTKMLVYTGQNENEPVVLHNMPSLRYLFLQNTKVLSNIGKLAPNLLWIRIRNCEFLSDIYTWLILRNRLQFDGSWSQIRMFSLELCASLTRTPKTLNNSVNLQCLNLEHSSTIPTIPNSVGNFSQLKQFNLGGCASLTSLPDTVGNLKQLKDLCLRGCTGLKSLPSTVGNLAQLQVLNLYGCRGLRVLPNSVGELEKLQVLNLHGCESLQSLPSKLRMLNFHGAQISDASSIWNLKSTK